jgi:predicted TPR repeat methyltransferase
MCILIGEMLGCSRSAGHKGMERGSRMTVCDLDRRAARRGCSQEQAAVPASRLARGNSVRCLRYFEQDTGSAWSHATRAYYDELAASYDSLYEDPASRSENHQVRAILSRLAHGECLDIGCGTGLGWTLSRDCVRSYVGLELSAAMVEQARCLHGESEHCHFYQCDVERLTLLPFQHDTVIALFGVLSHINDLPSLLNRTFAALRPGGVFIGMAVSRYAMSRVKRLQFAAYGNYRIRGSERNGHAQWWVQARFYTSWQLKRLLTQAGFEGVTAFGIEGGRSRWPIDLNHSLIVTGVRP